MAGIIPTLGGPKYRSLVTYESRLNTFRGYAVFRSVDSKLLANAGFWCNNCRLTCFYCGLILPSWKSLDNPWIEHFIQDSRCLHLKLNYGREESIEAGKVSFNIRQCRTGCNIIFKLLQKEQSPPTYAGYAWS